MQFVLVDNNKNNLDVLAGIMVFIADAMRPGNGFQLLQVLRKNIPILAVVMLPADERNRIDAFKRELRITS